MKTVTIYAVMSFAAMVFAGSALANQTIANQNLAKRPAISQAASEQPEQAWVGASLKTSQQPEMMAENRKQQFRQLLNLQYASKRPYFVSDATE